jgi:hypothetical protein
VHLSRRQVLAAAAGGVLLTGVSVGVAWASIPDSSGVIHGCYKPQGNGSNTALGVIDTALSGGHCPTGDTQLTWNQTGPQGPAGAQGPQGSPGLSNVNVVTGPVTGDEPPGPHQISCPAGQAALSITFENLDGLNQVFTATPTTDSNGVPTGYSYNNITANSDYQAAITCATVG